MAHLDHTGRASSQAAALRYVRSIQDQKAVEAANFVALEKLLDYPTQHKADAARPAPADILDVSRLLQSFRPTDFDELVEERRINNVCGYVLCASITHAASSRETTSISRQSDRSSLQTKKRIWCCPACLRRATFLKFQLSDEPAWLRPSGHHIDFRFVVGSVDLSAPLSALDHTQASEFHRHHQQIHSTNTHQFMHDKVDLGSSMRPMVHTDQPVLSAKVVEHSAPTMGYTQPESDNAWSYRSIEGYSI